MDLLPWVEYSENGGHGGRHTSLQLRQPAFIWARKTQPGREFPLKKHAWVQIPFSDIQSYSLRQTKGNLLSADHHEMAHQLHRYGKEFYLEHSQHILEISPLPLKHTMEVIGPNLVSQPKSYRSILNIGWEGVTFQRLCSLWIKGEWFPGQFPISNLFIWPSIRDSCQDSQCQCQMSLRYGWAVHLEAGTGELTLPSVFTLCLTSPLHL